MATRTQKILRGAAATGLAAGAVWVSLKFFRNRSTGFAGGNPLPADAETSARQRNNIARPLGQRDVRSLEGIYDAGTRTSPYIINLLHPQLDEEDVSARCIDISWKVQRDTYEYIYRLVEIEQLADLPRYDLIRRTVQAVTAPDVDWTRGPDVYPIDGAEERVWNGVGTIVDIVLANYEEKLHDEDELDEQEEDDDGVRSA